MKMNRKRKSKRERQNKMKMRRTSMGKHYVVLVERTTPMTSSGSDATYARDGSCADHLVCRLAGLFVVPS
ncbi:hypothetical protein Droror1_Dr00020100 [Drosera rotundifolia]